MGPRSLHRLFGVVEALAKSPGGRTLAELAVALDSPKSSVLMLLRSLVASGHLVADDGHYGLGPAMFRLAADIAAVRKLPRLVRRAMEALVTQTRETVYLAVLDREERLVTYADVIESPEPVRYAAPVGTRRPLHCSAAGRLLLAYQPEGWREQYLRSTRLRSMTARSLTDRKSLRRRLAEIRDAGVSISIGEAVSDAAGVAAPVWGGADTPAAALMVGGPADRVERQMAVLVPLVKQAAAVASGVGRRQEDP